MNLNGTEWDNLALTEGKIYTIFLSGDATSSIAVKAIQHN